MSETSQTATIEQIDDYLQTQGNEVDPLDVLVREFGQEAGRRVGSALADSIREDPEARRAAATGAGIGVGVIVGLGLLSLLMD